MLTVSSFPRFLKMRIVVYVKQPNSKANQLYTMQDFSFLYCCDRVSAELRTQTDPSPDDTRVNM